MKERTEGMSGERLPLGSALRRHAAQGRVSMHTPGHKGRYAHLAKLTARHDLTELPDTDALFECDGVIRSAEKKAAQVFGARYTAFSAGGCTLAIQGMLGAAARCSESKRIIMARNCHRAAVSACALLGLEPTWVYPTPTGDGLPGQPTAQSIAAALAENGGVCAVYVTSPDYYGVLADIEAIAVVCREKSVPLLVDNAHGSHLAAFGRHPLQKGASMTACSAHKTLPVLTGGALLNVSDERFIPYIKPAMALFGSTSPSYLVMASLEQACCWLERKGRREFERLAGRVEAIRERAQKAGFDIPEAHGTSLSDPTRITLLTARMGLTGDEAAQRLRECGVEPEHSDAVSVVLIATPFNSASELRRLERAIAKAARGAKPAAETAQKSEQWSGSAERVMSVREAVTAPGESVSVQEAVGRISAQTVSVCPPGIPIVMPGERINGQAQRLLSKAGLECVEVVREIL